MKCATSSTSFATISDWYARTLTEWEETLRAPAFETSVMVEEELDYHNAYCVSVLYLFTGFSDTTALPSCDRAS